MISVLVNAYACAPKMGSEPGMAWNWVINLANYCKVYVITEGEWKTEIEAAIKELPQGGNIKFYYNPVSEAIREMCWNQGDWRFYKHYKKWQYTTYQIAEEIIRKEGIAILHQLNMIGFREPGYLWKIKELPFVWGPVDAKQNFPVAYLEGASLKTKILTHLKNQITYLQLKYSKRVHLAAKKAAIVIAASSNSKVSFKKFLKKEVFLLNETGCYEQNHEIVNKIEKKELDLLWVGKLDFRKQLSIAIQTLANVANKDVILHIVGGGDRDLYKSLAIELGVEKQCRWHGLISHQEVQQKMQQSDLFLFTSVAEGTPHVVLEAIGNNLPVLCFDTCGQGDAVNEKVGIKISLSNPKKSAKDFSEEIEVLYNNRQFIEEMGANCKERQRELSWDLKAKKMVELYQTLVNK